MMKSQHTHTIVLCVGSLSLSQWMVKSLIFEAWISGIGARVWSRGCCSCCGKINFLENGDGGILEFHVHYLVEHFIKQTFVLLSKNHLNLLNLFNLWQVCSKENNIEFNCVEDHERYWTWEDCICGLRICDLCMDSGPSCGWKKL